MEKHHFEFVGGSSAKFWEIGVSGNDVTVRFGRIDSQGQTQVKTFHDAEGRVIEHLPGRGRHAGRLGAVVVVLPNGQTFSVGTGFTDSQRQNPPPVGSIVTVRYQELTDRGVPRFPSFVPVRFDAEAPVLV